MSILDKKDLVTPDTPVIITEGTGNKNTNRTIVTPTAYEFSGEDVAGSNGVPSSAARRELFDTVFSQHGGPGYQSPLVNTLTGIKVFGKGIEMTPVADEVIGWMFLNRPMLRLEDTNVVRSPKLVSLYKSQPNSIQDFVRCLLDPTYAQSSGSDSLFDNDNPWLSPMINLLKRSGGFPDLDIDVGQTSPGFRGEVLQYLNGHILHNGGYSIQQTLANTRGSILSYIVDIWLTYMYEVSSGDHGCEPYDEALQNGYKDYDTRIYHFVMDKNMRNIEGMVMCDQAILNSLPVGQYFTIDNDAQTRRAEGQDEISLNYSAVGLCYNNQAVIDSFNMTYRKFNNDFFEKRTREANYHKLDNNDLLKWQYRALPYINSKTMEMEWWLNTNKYPYNDK